jgi:thiamine biosynthesis lipoprotein
MNLSTTALDAAKRSFAGETGTTLLQRFTWRALGTECLVLFAAETAEQARQFREQAVVWVTRFEARYSRFREDSLLSRINAAAGREWVEIDAEMERMLDVCGTLQEMTRGILDATALPLLRLWNYRAERPRIPTENEIAVARRLVGWDKVERRAGQVFLPHPGMCLDFGGWGKEYAVDAVEEIAEACGITSALIDFGHDLRALAPPPQRSAWHVGLENPREPGKHRGSIAVQQRGVASSGDYRRSFTVGSRRYGHIVDPRSGYPVANRCLQTTVVAPSALQAGVLSTTAFVLGAGDGLRLIQETFGADGLIVTEDAHHQTRGFFNYVVEAI